ncbi:MAG TPA: hypothetical protein VER04_12335, partial [Polyangiaceae bacterium]|nr:hypothetical protein [Polyangiaceae bacterium]
MRIHRSSLAAALLACLLFLSRESRAEPHARDGFYLQLATGLGAAFWHSSGHNPHYTPALDFSGTQSGAGLNGSLLLGLPLRPGLSLGVGGLASTIAITSSTHETQDENPQLQLFGAVGP